jgi:hypothetical protein
MLCMVKNSPQPPKAVPVRIPPEMVARIDALKGDLVPREAYVRMLLDKAIGAEERKAAKERTR